MPLLPRMRIAKVVDAPWLAEQQRTALEARSWERLVGRFRRELLVGFSVSSFAAAIDAGDQSAVAELPWAAASSGAAAEASPIHAAALGRAGDGERRRLGFTLAFDRDDPLAQEWIAARGAELVTAVSDETARAVRGVVLDAFRDGKHPFQQARVIRDLVGLTARHAQAVQRFHENALAAGATVEQAEARARRYAGRLRRWRARNIARTETINASAEGRREFWRQAQRAGILPEGQKRSWIAAMTSGRTCRICLELGQHEPVGLDEPFYSEVLGRSVMGPTAHPSCRCSVALVDVVPSG